MSTKKALSGIDANHAVIGAGIVATGALLFHAFTSYYSYCNTDTALCKKPIIGNTIITGNKDVAGKSREDLLLEVKCEPLPLGEMESGKTSKHTLSAFYIIFGICLIAGGNLIGGDIPIVICGVCLTVIGLINLLISNSAIRLAGMAAVFTGLALIIIEVIEKIPRTVLSDDIKQKIKIISNSVLAVILLLNANTFMAGFTGYGFANTISILMYLLVILSTIEMTKITYEKYNDPYYTSIDWKWVGGIDALLLLLLIRMPYIMYTCLYSTYECVPEINLEYNRIKVGCKADIS